MTDPLHWLRHRWGAWELAQYMRWMPFGGGLITERSRICRTCGLAQTRRVG